ncbi:MAG TPA: SDR family oxidoreductase [Tepidisphaeraceae bacterium]|nr:SDR family oxidoreductase [Tepidisphaeraceae bacterium]
MPTALITGASVGIGHELARQFARAGYALILTARNREKLGEVAAEMKSLGAPAADVLTADLADPAGPQHLVQQLEGRPLDVLVNNAGFGAIGAFADIDLPRQLDMIRVNVTSLVELTHRLLPRIAAAGKDGGILNVASTASFQPGPFMAVYYATKAFVLSFSEALAEELKKTGVRVTALCPGPTHSEFRARAKAENSGIFKTSFIPVASAEAVAIAGFRAFRRGKRVVVPGVVNKIGVTANRLAPRTFAAKVAGKINRNK